MKPNMANAKTSSPSSEARAEGKEKNNKKNIDNQTYIIRSAYNGRRNRSSIKFIEPSKTKQSFKDECNINTIMARYLKTGRIENLNQAIPHYGYASANDLRESLEIVQKGDELFGLIPADIRAKFSNNPAAFLEFVQDEANLPEMASMGLLSEEATLTHAEPPKVATATPEPDTAPPPSPPSDKTPGGDG